MKERRLHYPRLKTSQTQVFSYLILPQRPGPQSVKNNNNHFTSSSSAQHIVHMMSSQCRQNNWVAQNNNMCRNSQDHVPVAFPWLRCAHFQNPEEVLLGSFCFTHANDNLNFQPYSTQKHALYGGVRSRQEEAGTLGK